MASREATINVNIADLPQVQEMLAAAKAEIERLQAIIDDAPKTMEPPRWGVHHPEHMAGWEAFGVTQGTPPTVRRLGTGYDGKGRPGTEKWGPGEVLDGVASMEIHTFSDHPAGAYIYVCGTDKTAVQDRWHVAEAAFIAIGGVLWPAK